MNETDCILIKTSIERERGAVKNASREAVKREFKILV
jgi:hypothetical protein